MSVLSTVLVPLDGSTLARDAVRVARDILPADAEVILLTVVDGAVRATLGGVAEAEHVTITEMVDTYHDQVEAELGGRPVARVQLIGEHPAGEILQTARSRGATSIVMASHGRTGLEQWLLGSVTDKVVRAADVPVVVVPVRNS